MPPLQDDSAGNSGEPNDQDKQRRHVELQRERIASVVLV